ncbi:MFS transporter [Burkholderia sp. HI2500]|uniref:MFS transporter n=1 Tax=Burkholderia sp. HI2500 TaxID=2015358 RepID=UPI000B79E993|nr:MFS transporter [Burkholderia sp. HI2500]OXJ11042.1 MFS transporter [Burkholderia sp. HI2500]
MNTGTECSTDGGGTAARSEADRVYARITRRLVPLLFLCYLAAFVNRNNIGLAKLQMQGALGFTDAVYGVAASAFFVGILLFELPSNLMLRRVGVRRTLLRIMVLWGLVAAATMFVRTPAQFYTLRFLLGAFEAGFFPGVVVYLTFWFPAERRAKVIALFMTAAAAAGLVTGPVSGWVLNSMGGVAGLGGWQWLMLLEGVPSVVLGVLAYRVLPEGPEQARWLSPDERRIVQQALGAPEGPHAAGHPLRAALREPCVYLLGFTTFSLGCATNLLIFWLPSIIEATGVTNLQHVGLYVVIPNLTGTIAMVWYGRRSDRRRERHVHFIVAVGAGIAGLCTMAVSHGALPGVMAGAIVATCGIASAYPVLWAIATRLLPRDAAAAGVALISSMGAASGVSSALFGAIRVRAGSLDPALYLVALALVAVVLLFACVIRPKAAEAALINQELRS